MESGENGKNLTMKSVSVVGGGGLLQKSIFFIIFLFPFLLNSLSNIRK